MTSTFLVWWTNPFTAALACAVAFLGVTLALSSFAAVARLGGIALRSLLADREELLPGYPRHGGGYVGLLLSLAVGVGLAALLLAATVYRLAHLVALPGGAALAILALAWLAAAALAFAVAHGGRIEGLTVATLLFLRPFTPALLVLSRQERAQEGEGGEASEEVDDHEIEAFIGAGEEAGILEREDAELITSIVELGDTIAREIMTPRTDVVALAFDASFEEVQRQFVSSMFSRLPVYRESLDHTEGVLHVKDVLRASAAGLAPRAGELMREVLVVPETKLVRDLLREFQAKRQQLAVVVDEYGGTSGIVTLEDVLEEIVGEIQDEHQRERPEVEAEGGGTYLVAGSAHVEVLEELFGIEMAEAGYDSVAGLVLERLGGLPRPGEKVSWRGIELEAVEVDRRRLKRVRVRRAEPSS